MKLAMSMCKTETDPFANDDGSHYKRIKPEETGTINIEFNYDCVNKTITGKGVVENAGCTPDQATISFIRICQCSLERVDIGLD